MSQPLVHAITFQIFRGIQLVATQDVAREVTKIGRDVRSHVRLDDAAVSRMHCVIESRAAGVFVMDLGSGTQLNGSPVNRANLSTGDELRIGPYRLKLKVGDLTAARETEAAPVATEVAPVSAAPAAARRPPPTPAIASVLSFTSDAAAKPGTLGVDGEEIYQLVKRGDINPSDVEHIGTHAVEVTVLWKTAILHVGHLDETRGFVLSTREAPRAPAGRAMLGGLMAGSSCIAASAATGNYVIGAMGTAMALAGAGAGIVLDRRNHADSREAARFVVGSEVLASGADAHIVRRDALGTAKFVFQAGAEGDVDADGTKRTLAALVADGTCKPSLEDAGSHEIEMRPGARYRMEIGGLTVLAKIVAAGRRVMGAPKRDRVVIGAWAGAAAAVAMLLGGGYLATASDSTMMANTEEDQLRDLRRIMDLAHEHPQPVDPSQSTGTGGPAAPRAAGAEGAAGRPDTAVRNRRMSVRDNGIRPHISQQASRDIVQHRGIFAALGPQGAPESAEVGTVSPFAEMSSGTDAETHLGGLDGDIGDSFGVHGLGRVGIGHGGGGDNDGPVAGTCTGPDCRGMFGTSNREGVSGTGGRRLTDRADHTPALRPGAPTTDGGLAADVIRRVVLRNLGQVEHCQEQGMSVDPTLSGRVVVMFVINGQGSVAGSRVVENNVSVPSVATCIANAVRRWTFPQPEGNGIATVTYPFNLQRAM